MHRGWQNNPVFKKEKFTQREFWEWLVGSAAYEPMIVNIHNNPVTLQRGQLSFSIRFMAKFLGWPESSVLRFLNHLKKWDMIETESGTGQNVITICNYDKYQFTPRSFETVENKKAEQGRCTSETNKKEYKKPKQNKEIKNTSNTAANDFYLFEALKIWEQVCGDKLPIPAKLTTPRKSKLRARLKELGGLEGWSGYCQRIRGSPFCCGDNERGWKADFDFALSQEKMTRIIEGKYDGRPSRQKTKSELAYEAIARAIPDREADSEFHPPLLENIPRLG